MFSKKTTKIDEISTLALTLYVVNVKSEVEILSIFEAFSENMIFTLKLETSKPTWPYFSSLRVPVIFSLLGLNAQTEDAKSTPLSQRWLSLDVVT